MGFSRHVSWSFTRMKSLNGCPRAHFFRHFYGGEEFQTKVELLKNLVPLPMMRGQVVDRLIGRQIDRMRIGKPVEEDLPDQGQVFFDQAIKSSEIQTAKMREGLEPKKHSQPLLEHYYERRIEPELIDSERGRVSSALTTFIGCQIKERIGKTRSTNWIPPTKPKQKFRAEKWEMDGIPLYSQIDFWMRVKGDRLVIFDWKSGKFGRSDDQFQLAVYSLWGQQKFNLSSEQVYVQAVRLEDSGDFDPKPVPQDLLQIARETITKTYSKEIEKLVKERNGYRARSEDFPATPSKSSCLKCVFLEICKDGRTLV